MEKSNFCLLKVAIVEGGGACVCVPKQLGGASPRTPYNRHPWWESSVPNRT